MPEGSLFGIVENIIIYHIWSQPVTPFESYRAFYPASQTDGRVCPKQTRDHRSLFRGLINLAPAKDIYLLDVEPLNTCDMSPLTFLSQFQPMFSKEPKQCSRLIRPKSLHISFGYVYVVACIQAHWMVPSLLPELDGVRCIQSMMTKYLLLVHRNHWNTSFGNNATNKYNPFATP